MEFPPFPDFRVSHIGIPRFLSAFHFFDAVLLRARLELEGLPQTYLGWRDSSVNIALLGVGE